MNEHYRLKLACHSGKLNTMSSPDIPYYLDLYGSATGCTKLAAACYINIYVSFFGYIATLYSKVILKIDDFHGILLKL